LVESSALKVTGPRSPVISKTWHSRSFRLWLGTGDSNGPEGPFRLFDSTDTVSHGHPGGMELRLLRAARRSKAAQAGISFAEYALIGSLVVVLVMGAAVFFG